MKSKKFLASLFLAIFSVFVLASCKDGSSNASYIVSFEVNGGSAIEAVTTEDGVVTKPADPTRDGYIFKGWYEDAEFTNPFDFDTEKVDANTTLYAKWEEAKDDEKVYTIAEIIAMCADYPSASTERFYVRGTVVEISDPNYGEMTIEDETGSILVYGTYSADGEDRYSDLTDKPVKGDTVLLYGTIQQYGDTPEIKSGWIIEFTHNEPEIDINDYESMSISQARTKEAGSLVLLEGVVAAFTYNASLNPIGFILVDNTSSIYVYDSQIAPQVKVGNKIQIAGSRDNWILDSEKTFAEEFGYEGCVQISNCILVENDNKTTNTWDNSWVEESTVKTLIDTDVKAENITSKIYKVNALVKEVQSPGFTNFYFYDIDETTGTYTYTQASGEDFTWLREFDGKVCTVYLMVLNYKSSAAGVVARFLPVSVKDDNYQFDLSTTAQTVLDYYVKDQFVEDTYYANPELELVTSVTNNTLGFENVSVSYASNNAAITFAKQDDKYIMNIDASNNVDVEITVTVSYNDQTVEWKKTIHVKTLSSFNYTDIKTATATAFGTEVTIRGIVGPSLVNRVGFYLIDETGMVAVTTTEATLATLKIGDEVILRGNHVEFRKDTTTVFGQRVIQDSEILRNLYGNNEYPTNSFITDKDLAYIYNLDANEDHTTEVYVVKATINVVETNYYTSINLTDGDTKLELYSASANQYSWLFDYKGQEVTLGIAPCNWNDKKFYKGCVLFVQLADGTIINNTLNFD